MLPTKKNITATGISADDVYSDEFARRRIYLTQAITPDVSADIIAQINCLVAQSSEDIHLIIQSPGGQVSAALAILDVMNTCGADVFTYVIGEAASAAALLASAGKRRFISENSEMLIHQPLGGSSGQASDIERAAKHILKIKKKIHTILAENTGQSYEKICEDCDRDYYLDAYESIAYGLVDELFSGFD